MISRKGSRPSSIRHRESIHCVFLPRACVTRCSRGFSSLFSPEEDRRFRVTVHLTSLIIDHRNRSGLRDSCRTIADDYDTRGTFRIRIGRFVYVRDIETRAERELHNVRQEILESSDASPVSLLPEKL